MEASAELSGLGDSCPELTAAVMVESAPFVLLTARCIFHRPACDVGVLDDSDIVYLDEILLRPLQFLPSLSDLNLSASSACHATHK